MPNRLTPMATDGQGVLLAVNQSSDTRQRTTMDVLSRRVAHRLGCPVSVVQVQRGVPLMQAPLEQLAAKGVHNTVMVPVDPYQTRIESLNPESGQLDAKVNSSTVNVRLADGIGADPQLIDALLEALQAAERSPDPDTALVVGVPQTHNGMIRRLSTKSDAVRAAGWGGLGFVEIPVQDGQSDQPPSARMAPPLPPSALFVPLAVNPGPFVTRCENIAPNLKAYFSAEVAFAPTTLHATTTLGQMIRDRVQQARRT